MNHSFSIQPVKYPEGGSKYHRVKAIPRRQRMYRVFRGGIFEGVKTQAEARQMFIEYAANFEIDGRDGLRVEVRS